MKKLIVALCLLPTLAFAGAWDNNPNNFKNSPNNFDNSPNNFKNSPNNFKNSPNNFNSKNGVYDNAGNRTGYTVPKSNGGGVNVFDNNGKRTGYSNW
tara:strand:- start:560 stop:850 length:291 start_codon:yes stop_codon:yes gene_type:complete